MKRQATQTNTAYAPASAARNIQAIWSHKNSANVSQQIQADASYKEFYAADRATD